jgi:(1->4)-alpha-D-glucan 1-alpha-D-glucosylmutase
MREAAVHTRWTQPNLALESALTEFVDSLLSSSQDDPFLKDFLAFQHKVSYWGMLNSLSQVLLKIVCPGVPDFYQGVELWDLHMVDPDNRGRVDFGQRTALLKSIQEQVNRTPAPEFLQTVLKNWLDGRIKLYLIFRALNFRRKHSQLFLEGDYVPVEARGKRKRNVVAVARSYRGEHIVAAVPRWLAAAKAPPDSRGMQRFWAGSELVLQPRAPAHWFNVLTGEQLTCRGSRRALSLGAVFQHFPVALLFEDRSEQAMANSE